MPVASAAMRASPSHPFAGVNLMLARQALGDREAVRALLPQLQANPSLDDWGRAQIASARAWALPMIGAPDPG